MKAAQQKNCTSPTLQNAEGASLRSRMMFTFSSFNGLSSPCYSAYSLGGISFTLTVV